MQHNIDKIFRNSRITVWLHQLLTLISSLVITRLLIQELGIDEFGILSIYISIFTLITSTDFGLSYSLSRFISRNNKAEVDTKERNSFYVACLLSIILVSILQFIGLVLSGYLYMSFDPVVPVDVELLIVVGIIVNMSFIFGLNRFVFAGFQMYGIHGLSKIANIILYITVIYYLYSISLLDLENTLWVFALTKLIANIIMSYILIKMLSRGKRWPWKNYNGRDIKKKMLELIRYGLLAWLFSLSTIIYATLTVLIAGVFLSGGEVSSLKIILVILSMLTSSITGFMQPLSTIVSQYGNSEKAFDAFNNLYVNVIILSVIAGILYLFYGEICMEYLLGGDTNSLLAQKIFKQSLVVTLPVLIFMPLFISRFAIVENEENSKYSRIIFYSTSVCILLGTIGVIFYKDLFSMLLAISFAVTFRSIYAYHVVKDSDKPKYSLIRMVQHIIVLSIIVYLIVSVADKLVSLLLHDEIYIIVAVSLTLFLLYIPGSKMLRNYLIVSKKTF